MKYNKNLSETEIKSLENERALLFDKIGKYAFQYAYYQEKVHEYFQKIDILNQKLFSIN